jgi:exosortase/archaeosortase family protein
MKKERKNRQKKAAQSESNQLAFILARYVFLLAIGLFLAYSGFFYKLFLLLTIYPVSFLLSIFYDSFVYQNMVLVETMNIEIISACVAVSAYFLLLILNFTVSMSLKQRIKTLIFSFAALLILNILRIFILSVLLLENFVYFDIVHKIFWYSLSILFVAGIWLLAVFLFGVKNIPVYSDFKFIFSLLKSSKKN